MCRDLPAGHVFGVPSRGRELQDSAGKLIHCAQQVGSSSCLFQLRTPGLLLE